MQQRDNHKPGTGIKVTKLGQWHPALGDVRIGGCTDIADRYTAIIEETKPARDAHMIGGDVTPEACSSRGLDQSRVIAHLRADSTDHILLDRSRTVEHLI